MSKFQDLLFVDREKKYRGFKKLLEPTTRQSVMLIKSPEKMGKTWLAIKFERHCDDPLVNLPVVRIDFRNPLDQLKITDHLAFVRLLRDRLDEPDYFRQLNATINQLTAQSTASRSGTPTADASTNSRRLAELAQEMQTVFNLAELQQQSLFLDVQFENLGGTTLFDKAYGLVSHFARRGTLAKLFEMLTAERSHIEWSAQFADLLETTAADMTHISTAAPQEEQFKDENYSLAGLTDQELTRARRLINDAFFDAIADLIRDREQVVFLLDAHESAPRVAEDFIRNQLLVRTLDERLANMVIVIMGREVPDISELGIHDRTVNTGLDNFNAQYVRDFMLSRDIPEDTGGGVDSVLLFSGGVPGILALMADQAKMALQDDDDFFD